MSLMMGNFKKVNRIEDVEKYKECLLKVAEEQLTELEDDEFYYHEIIGLEIVTDEGEVLGKVTEILSPGSNDVWVVNCFCMGIKSITCDCLQVPYE